MKRDRTFGNSTRWRLAIVLLSFAGLVLYLSAMNPEKSGADASGWYSRDKDETSCGGGVIDPVGAIFAGTHAGVSNTIASINAHSWPFGGTGIGDQRLKVFAQSNSFVCRLDSEGAVSYPFGEGGWDRYHVRLWGTWEAGGSPKTAGTPHHERLYRAFVCGVLPSHAVLGYGDAPNSPLSGFELGKHRLKDNFADAGHAVGTTYYGNDMAIQQCTGHYAANGDGYVALIYLNHAH